MGHPEKAVGFPKLDQPKLTISVRLLKHLVNSFEHVGTVICQIAFCKEKQQCVKVFQALGHWKQGICQLVNWIFQMIVLSKQALVMLVLGVHQIQQQIRAI
jgi:hypothetical protein